MYPFKLRILEVAWIVGAPLSLAIVELYHPHPHDLLNVDVDMWLTVHYAQIPLFALTALAIAWLVRGRRDVLASVCRAAMFVFGVTYIVFDTAAGVVTGILVEAAHETTTPDAWRDAIDAIWTHPIVGGSPLIPAPILAVAGGVALSVGAVAGALSLKRSGNSWPPVVLLAVSSFGIGIFRTHAWPGGPLTFGGMAIAAGWLLWERARAQAHS